MGHYIKETIKNSLKNQFSAQMLTKNLHAVERFNKETTFKELGGGNEGGGSSLDKSPELKKRKEKKKTF